ncbi:MAG: hypothetical protein QM809_10225 [Gordonia sp. (in: high G+C Gram-positive bacteria)]|uniref:hypothetical protein n=1 Tax=Gordonia sp. (in: high G+C Gram-positive bacteria) TaxID=84139 RepID=UPI0039E4FDE6
MKKLDAKQVVPLTSDEAAELRTAAKTRSLTQGLFARTLVVDGLARLAAGDAGLDAAIEAEKTAAAARISAGARAAVARRWER